MSLYALGDPHLSLGGDKPMDIFPGWEGYLPRLEANWRKLVRPEDTVMLPGDISWAMSLRGTRADFAFLHSLPGAKVLSKGNHDYWWSTMTGMQRYLAEEGFDSIRILHNNTVTAGPVALCGSRGWFFDDPSDFSEKIINRECGRIRMSIAAAEETGLQKICFLHYPPVTCERECTPIMDVLRESGITRCYYAHLHGGAIAHAFNGERDGIQFRLVSADALGFCPLLIEKY